MVTSDVSGDETVHVMSEIGVTKILSDFGGEESKFSDKNIKLVNSGRIGPGEMISVDLKSGKLSYNDDLKSRVAQKLPYEKWVASSIQDLPTKPFYNEVKDFLHKYVDDPATKTLALAKISESDYYSAVTGDVDDERLIIMQSAFGWGTEDVEVYYI